MRTYEQSQDIERIASKLIMENHEHLKNVAIAYLMHKVDDEAKDPLKLPAKRIGQKHTIATAKIVPENYHCLTGFHFMLTVDERFWLQFPQEKRTALIDHELKHMRRDADGCYCAAHDLKEFADIINRHGKWKSDINRFFESIQMTLPFEDSRKDNVISVN